MEKLRHRKVELFVQGYSTTLWQSWGSNLVSDGSGNGDSSSSTN